ncbi:MAG TPA: HAD family hydrolase [Firmicutes bacterium]|nr:HAD family hydrolase [Bacillota bacterium]
MSAQVHVFVDWDDTLKVTNALYTQVSRENAGLLLQKLPQIRLSVEQITTLAHDIDLSKAEARGLNPENYPSAWVDVYRQLAQEHSTDVEPRLAALLYEKAAAVPYMEQADYPGARQLLTQLRELGCEITIWTAGDAVIQTHKVERSGYRPLVDRLYVTPDKNVQTLRAALGPRRPEDCCVIGNSPRSDIAPALELGMHAVHVLQDTWAYDVVPIDGDDPRYVRVTSLLEIPDVLGRLFPALAS